MPSFLSKVFGRKKGDEKDSATPRSTKRISDPSLLEGKFEAVPSTISPSTPKFPEGTHASDKGKDKEGDKGGPFGLLRSKSKPQPSSPTTTGTTTDTPHLTLRLPATIDKNGGSLDASFNPQADESDDSISTRRLTPLETLVLIQACSKAITERGGLETLGVMRPHWHSASPHLQRKLISLFILSLAQKSPETTLVPSTSLLSVFDSELEYTRSVHDIAAVFRWALRHLKLEGASFGSSPSSDEWSWYNKFNEAERKSSYDPRVFTTKLVPELLSIHTQLLIPILDIISSLAAHAEANGYSGSKLSKYFGFWLLTAHRGAGTEDWNSFYTRWEASGRMLEHLFLSWLRDENTKRPLPRRLQELVAQYPYTNSPDPTTDGLLTRPRFSTRCHDALFVRVETVYADNIRIQSSRSPVGIFSDALNSVPKYDSGAYVYLWDQVKAAAASDPEDRPLPAILSDDTINLFSLISTDPNELVLLGTPAAASTLVTPLSPVTEAPLSPIANGNGIPAPARKPTFPSSTPQSPKDWADFSSAGFGETAISKNFASTLLDKDLEVTEPPLQSRPSKRRQNRGTASTKPSIEFSPLAPKPKAAPEEPEGPKLILVATEVVQLDEAFIDFWRDAAMDPISGDWPKFVVGELRHPLTLRSISTSSEDGENVAPGSPINWIVIEEKFRRATPPPTPVVPHEALPSSPTSSGLKVAASPLKRTSSPRPSFGDKKSSSLTATLKRFTLFGSSRDDLTEDADSAAGGSGKRDGKKKKRAGTGKSPMIGELGEVLSEEPESQPEVPERLERVKESERGKGEVVAATAGVVGGVAAGSVLASVVGGGGKKVEVVEDVPTEEVTKTKDNELPALPPAKDEVSVALVPEVPLASTPAPEEPTPIPPVTSTTEPEEAQKSLPEVPPIVQPAADEVSPDESSEPVPVEPTPDAVEETQPESETLPPAPESVVSHGETPGPQLALDSTEVGLHHVPEPATDVQVPQRPATDLTDDSPVDTAEETADFGYPSPKPTIQHLKDKVEDPAADAGVDLDPIPIVPDDPVEPVEVVPEPPVVESTPEPIVEESEPPATVDEKIEEPTAQDDVPVTEVSAVSSLPPSVCILEEPGKEEDTSAQPVTSEPEPTEVLTEGVPDVSTSGPVPQPADAELHSSTEEPTDVQEAA